MWNGFEVNIKAEIMDKRTVLNKKYITCLVLGASLVASSLVNAQSGYYFVPRITILEGYDDNLLFSENNKQSGLFTRISPELDVGYESGTLTWNGRYNIDTEIYGKYSELDRNPARQFAEAQFEYLPTARLVMAANASWARTNTPIDLNPLGVGVIPGLLIGRIDAERASVNPSLEYRFTPTTTGVFTYTLTRDKLIDAVESEVQAFEAGFTTRISAVNSFSYGYIYRELKFDDISGAVNPRSSVDQNSQIPWVGKQHVFSRNTIFNGRVGPRLFGNYVKPFIQLNLHRTFQRGDIILDYERDETTLLGEFERVENQAVSATFMHRFSQNLEMRVVPGFAELTRDGFAAQVFRFGIYLGYRVNSVLSLTASYDLNRQRLASEVGPDSTVSRGLVLLGFSLSYPRRDRTVAI